jgi:hypothetical protein
MAKLPLMKKYNNAQHSKALGHKPPKASELSKKEKRWRMTQSGE